MIRTIRVTVLSSLLASTGLASVLVAAPQCAEAATISFIERDDGSGVAVLVKGDLEVSDGEKFDAKTSALPQDTVVVFNSDGGHVVAGIQIGETIRLKGFTTIVVNGNRCASACAIAWLGGAKRFAGSTAKIGFHAAYDQDTGQEGGMANAIVGAYLTRIGLGYEAIAYVTAASPQKMTWMTFEAAKKVGISVLPFEFPPRRKALAPQPVPVPAQATVEQHALQLVGNIIANTFNNPQVTLAGLYWDAANYFGKVTLRQDILIDKQKFAERWPVRSYKIRPGTAAVACSGGPYDGEPQTTECKVTGVVDWETSNKAQRSVGAATFDYTLRPWPLGSWRADSNAAPDLRISGENGKVLQRQITAIQTRSLPSAPKPVLHDPDEVAMVVGTMIVANDQCGLKGNDYPFNVAVAKLGQDFVDFQPDNRYAPLVKVKVKKAYEFISGYGKLRACEGMREVLMKFLPDIYTQGK